MPYKERRKNIVNNKLAPLVCHETKTPKALKKYALIGNDEPFR